MIMQNKVVKVIMLLIGLLLVTGCGTKEEKQTKLNEEGTVVTLSKQELNMIKKTEDALLGLLLSKATYKEATGAIKNGEEKIRLDMVRRKAVNDYYILSLANKNINVTDEEVEKVYEANKKDLDGKELKEVRKSIETLIYEAKLNRRL